VRLRRFRCPEKHQPLPIPERIPPGACSSETLPGVGLGAPSTSFSGLIRGPYLELTGLEKKRIVPA
jgi:hypothetical protein